MSYPTAYIGCDPGKSGGIAIITAGITPATFKMPETERDLLDLVKSLSRWHDCPVIAAVEVVHAMPGQGVTSMFTFGRGYGALRMALHAAEISFRDVTPQAWQKALGCRTAGNKNVSKAKAQQLFPTIKVTHANADALLIAEWLRQQP